MAEITSRTNSDGSVTVYADGVKRVTHPAGSELAESSKQFETTPGYTNSYSGTSYSSSNSSSNSSNSSSNSSSNLPTIYRDADGNIYDSNHNLLNMEEFQAYTANGAIEGGIIDNPNKEDKNKDDEKIKAEKEKTKLEEEKIKLEEEKEIEKKKEEEDAARLESSYAIIDAALANGQISSDTAFLYKTVVNNYQGVDVNFDEIITELEDIKSKVISPEYLQTTTEALADVKASKSQIETARTTELETEKFNQQQELDSLKDSYETSGLTFSGEAAKILGDKSATSQDKTTGTLGEGTLGAYQRRISSSSQAEYLNNLRNLTRTSENTLGSNATSDLGLTEGLVGGQQGSIAKNKETDIANTLNSLFSNREKAQNLGSSQLNQ